MANKLYEILSGGIFKKLTDMGDGSWAETVVVNNNLNTSLSVVTGNITGNAQSIVLPLVNGASGATFVVTGTFAGVTLAYEVSFDNQVTWVPVNGVPINGTLIGSSSAISTNTAFNIYCAGASHFRVRSTAWTSGTATVRLVPVSVAQDPTPAVTLGAPLPGGASAIGSVYIDPRVGSSGLSVARLVSAAATTNATSVKATAGRVYKITGLNVSATPKYLKLYNKASAPTVGTDVPVITIALKADDTFDIKFDAIGHHFATGIAYAITGAAGDTDTTALAAADVVGLNIWYF